MLTAAAVDIATTVPVDPVAGLSASAASAAAFSFPPTAISTCSVVAAGGEIDPFVAVPNSPITTVSGTLVVSEFAVIDVELAFVRPLEASRGPEVLTPA